MGAEVLRQAFASTAGVLAKVATDQLDLPTPCASWTVRDLVNHIVGGTTYVAVTAETGTAPPVGNEDHTTGDFKAEFREGAERAVQAFSSEGAMDKTMKLPFGELPGSIFVMVAANDTFTHGWDLATATGQSRDLDPGLAAHCWKWPNSSRMRCVAPTVKLRSDRSGGARIRVGGRQAGRLHGPASLTYPDRRPRTRTGPRSASRDV